MKPQIVSKDDILQTNKALKYLGGKPLASIILWILRINKLNKIYSRFSHQSPSDFVHSITQEFRFQYEITEESLKNIPKSGPFMLIANHPFGGAEAIITLEIIKNIRPDFKYMANFLLSKIEPMKPFFISVNPFETMQHLRSSYIGIKMANEHIEQGNALGIFPAGEVSTFQKSEGKISDKPWPRSIMKFIKVQEVPIVPVYYMGKNSQLFYFLGRIHPMLRTLKLPSELLNKKNQLIKIRLGEPITVERQKEINDLNDFTNFIRNSVYELNQ